MLNEKINEKSSVLMALTRRSSDQSNIFDLKSFKISFNRQTLIRIFLLLILFIVIVNRSHVICLFGFVNCYITWPFYSPEYVQFDLNNLDDRRNKDEFIPRYLHHILLGPLSQNPPLNWILARNSCLEIHSNYDKFFFWDDQTSEIFLNENYRWFLKTWYSYKTIVQKADALRYFVLYHYGGIFLDMDLFCRRSLNGIVNYLDKQISSNNEIFLAVKAFPVGISNGFMITTKGHSLLRKAVDNLELYNRNFLIPHATIVISTGPMFLSIQIQLNRSLWNSILVLDGKENMLGGKTETPLFIHFGTGSWHKADEKIFKNIPMNIQHQSQTFSISIVVLIVFFIFILIGKQKSSIKAFLHRAF